MIVIAIIGILAAIALPAYARYMARARFTEVVQATDGVKKQVELCIFAEGTTSTFTTNGLITANCNNGSSGDGYRIGAATDYNTKYVATIAVVNGTITATSNATQGMVDAAGAGATYIIEPHYAASGTADNGIVNWMKADGNAPTTQTSSCIAADLC